MTWITVKETEKIQKQSASAMQTADAGPYHAHGKSRQGDDNILSTTANGRRGKDRVEPKKGPMREQKEILVISHHLFFQAFFSASSAHPRSTYVP